VYTEGAVTVAEREDADAPAAAVEAALPF